jgi:MFS family permease
LSSILANSTAGATRSLKQDLRANLADGAGFSVMMGAGEAYLPAFALALGLGEVLSGLVASVPMMAGAVLQLASPAAVRRLGSHKRWVVICATCQALSFLPLIAAAIVGRLPALGVFAVASVYWACGLATGPAWNTWMEGLVPRSIRPRFFAFRTRITQAGMVTGLLAGGVALQVGKGSDAPLLAFAALFTAAFLGRSLSAFFLSRQSEPTPSPERLQGVGLSQVLTRFRQGKGNGILFYLLSVQAAVWLSGPYFTPYMLKKLHLSYGEFALLTAAAVSAKVLSLPFFGRYAQRAGTRRLLWIGGLGIVPLSGLWLVSNDFWYLMVLQITGGVAWAAYELAMFLLFFETIDAKERTGVLTIYNVGNALATVGGSLVGWTMLKLLGETQSAYLALFVASSFCRIGALVLLARVTGVIDAFRRTIPVVMRTVAISPGMGSIDRPILSSIPGRQRTAITSLPIVSTAAASASADVVPAPKHMPTTQPRLATAASTTASVAS